MLVAATYDAATPAVTLTFDRAVDAGGIVPTTVSVFDGNLSALVRNTAEVEVVSPETVTLVCIVDGEFTGEGVTMSASGATGIVSALGGEPWAGCSDVGLPFP